MGKIAFLFPGQGSQVPGMGQQLAKDCQKSKEIFQLADRTLDMNLSQLMFQGPLEELTKTYNAQPALVTASTAICMRLQEEGVTADFVAGHSLGEYSALVAANVLSFEEAVYAVRKRGEYMEQAVPNGKGGMAAILGLAGDKLKELTATVTEEGYLVAVANINSPKQTVISGTKEGIRIACERAKEAGARRAIPLQVSGPFHSSLMKSLVEPFEKTLSELHFQNSSIPIFMNVYAEDVTDRDVIKDNLLKQLYSPVLWQQSIENMMEAGVDTFVEVGPGNVLTGLVKQISRSVQTFSVHDEESIQKLMNALGGENANG